MNTTKFLAVFLLGAILGAVLNSCFAPTRVHASPDFRAQWEQEATQNDHVVNDRRYAEHVIRVVWGPAGAPVNQALRVVDCETGGKFNHDAVGRAGEIGYFQIHPIHGHPRQRLLDPLQNATIALELYQRNGWYPWTCAYIVGVI